MTAQALPFDRFSRSGGAVAALFALTPAAAMGGALLIAPLIVLVALIATPWSRLVKAVASAGLPLYLLAAFLAWTALSSLWVDPSKGIDTRGATDLIAFAPFVFLLALASAGARAPDWAMARRAAVAGVALLIALIAIETAFNFPIGRHLAPLASAAAPAAAKVRGADASLFYPDAARATLVALCCVWGALAILARRGWLSRLALAALLAGACAVSAFYGGGVDVAAYVLGLAAAGCALIWPRATVSIAAQILAGLIVLAPLALPLLTDLSAQALAQLAAWKPAAAEAGADAPLAALEPPFGWLQRAHAWAYAADLTRQHVLQGWGFGASAQFQETYVLRGFTLPYIPGHPHNAPLQIWLETGAVGALLAAGALASFGRRAGAALAEDRIAAAAAAGLLVSSAVIVNVNGGTWALWWWGALALGAAMIRVAKRPS